MSTVYGGYGSGGYGPTGKVNFGWIGEAWTLFSQNAGIWIVAVLAQAAPVLLLYAIIFAMGLFPGPNHANQSASPAALVGIYAVEFVYYLIHAFLLASVLRMAVRQVRGLPIRFEDIFGGGPVYWRMVGFLILAYFLMFALEFLCLFPVFGAVIFTGMHGGMNSQSPNAMSAGLGMFGGMVIGILAFSVLFFIFVGLLLPAFALIADGEPVFTSIGRSISAMKSQWLLAGLFVFVGSLLWFIGGLFTCGLGLFILLPMAWLIPALTYRDMIGMPGLDQGGYSALPPTNQQPGVWPPPPTQGQAPPQYPPQPPPFGGPPQVGQNPNTPRLPRESLSSEPMDEGNPPPQP